MTAGRDADAMMQASDARRRHEAAMRLLPILAALLCALPLIWRADGAWETSRVVTYVFCVWASVIACAAVLARIANQQPKAQDDV